MVTDTTIANLKIWLEQAQSWLRADGSTDALQKPHRQLLEMMSRAREQNHASRVWDLISEMEKLALHMTDPREQGEVFIRCAKMAADLENLKDALRLFQAAESKYKSYPHQRAVTFWMIGCIHWVSHQKVDGISTWQDAISLFKDRQLNVQIDSNKAKWYIGKLPELEMYLEEAIKLESLPPYNPDLASVQDPTPKKDTHPTGDTLRKSDFLRWLSCRVSESVPASGFGPVGYDPDPNGFLEITEVMIDNMPHLVFDIHSSSTHRSAVNIAGQALYMTIHVRGTSMNAAKPVVIEDGDYILVQAQAKPADNDIVVAGIFGQDEQATVKRLKYSNGKIRLIPESKDPSHFELDWEKEFSEDNGKFRIIGVVVAVFKKKH